MEEIKKYTIFQNGSAWLKADFHLHTKADKQFSYLDEENDFINKYIAMLKQQNISLGVITNHNKFNKDEFKNLRKKARTEEIFLLPGIELSVGDGANGIHTLIVFSDQWLDNGQDYINQFLNVAFEGKTPNQYEQEDGRSSLSLLDTIKKLNGYQKDYFLIFAHIEQASGLWSEVDGGRIGDFGKNKLFRERTLAFQKVRTRNLRDKIKLQLKDWYPAEVEGSDCKSIDEIGTKGGETWLKIGDFTFEAVKYALKDYTNRIRNSKPERYKHSYIKSVAFEGGTLDGHMISFSPGLNTLIGIRGSGKSSILEAVRYVIDIPFGERATDTEYKSKLIKHTLGSGGKAIITAVDQFGSEFQIRRILNEFPECYVDGKLQPGISIRETIIRNPIYFGQKDLSSSGEGFEKDLVEKLVGESLYDLRHQIEEKKQAVSEAVSRLLKTANINEQIEEYTRKKQDAEFNLKKFTEYGIEGKFKKQTDFNTDDRKLSQIISDLENYIDDFETFLSNHEDVIRNHATYSSEQNREFFDQFLKIYSEVVTIFDNLKKEKIKAGVVLAKLKNRITDFRALKQKFTEEFAETRRKIQSELRERGAASLNLEEYPQLKSKIDTAGKMLEALSRQKEQKTTFRNNLLNALSELNKLWLIEFQAIKDQLDKINSRNSSLQISAEFKGDKKDFLEFFKNIFRGSNIRESTLSGIVSQYADFGNIYQDFEHAKTKVGSSPETFEKYFTENLHSLLTFQVQNKFTIYYRGKELQHHSLGQRASALILFIFNQHDNDVIMIDQPEDDLDNQTIYEDVIKLIRELKLNTQFIFATHNANFPVLGDAEQVISCRYSDERVKTRIGSIDSPVLQKEIVDIMEGGEDAFNKRKEIYGIWNPQN